MYVFVFENRNNVAGGLQNSYTFIPNRIVGCGCVLSLSVEWESTGHSEIESSMDAVVFVSELVSTTSNTWIRKFAQVCTRVCLECLVLVNESNREYGPKNWVYLEFRQTIPFLFFKHFQRLLTMKRFVSKVPTQYKIRLLLIHGSHFMTCFVSKKNLSVNAISYK